MYKTCVSALFALLAAASVASGQSTEGITFGFGIGGSLVTGTPERPAPKEGSSITGAGMAPMGVHLRAIVEIPATSWMRGRAELFANRFKTSSMTYNCISDHQFCYPAAEIDRSVGLLVGARMGLMQQKFQPSIHISGGVADYTLRANREWFFGLQDSRSQRPIYKVGIGGVLNIGTVTLLPEAALLGSFGDGGGANQIPITVSVMWD